MEILYLLLQFLRLTLLRRFFLAGSFGGRVAEEVGLFLPHVPGRLIFILLLEIAEGAGEHIFYHRRGDDVGLLADFVLLLDELSQHVGAGDPALLEVLQTLLHFLPADRALHAAHIESLL